MLKWISGNLEREALDAKRADADRAWSLLWIFVLDEIKLYRPRHPFFRQIFGKQRAPAKVVRIEDYR